MQHPTNTTMSAAPKSLDYDPFRDAYKDYNKQILSHSKTKEWKQQTKHEWAHKQLCLQHTLYPKLIQKHFTSTEIPAHLFNICQCDITKHTVDQVFDPVLRISLDKALEPSNWKTKPAHFADL
eukprot:342473_1